MGLSNTPTPPTPKPSKKSKKNLTPSLLLLLILLLMLVGLIAYLINNNNSDSSEISEISDIDIEIRSIAVADKKILTLQELSILARACRAGNEAACNLLDRYYPMNRELERAAELLKKPANTHILNISRIPVFPDLKFFLQQNKKDAGKILSTDRIWQIGRTYFVQRLPKDLLRNLDWIMIYYGYDLEQWQQNHFNTNEEPQIEIHLTLPWRMLCISEQTLAWKMLRKQGLKDIYNLTIKDFLDAYNAAKNKGEVSQKLEKDIEYTLKQYKISNP